MERQTDRQTRIDKFRQYSYTWLTQLIYMIHITDTDSGYIHSIHTKYTCMDRRMTDRWLYIVHIYMKLYIPYTIYIQSINTQYIYTVYTHSIHTQVICSSSC